MYDDLLSLDLGGYCRGISSSSLVAFVDDVAVIATDNNTTILEQVMNQALSKVSTWMEENNLNLSVQKSVAVILTNKQGYEEPRFVLNGVEIKPSEHIRYLGVELSRRRGFRTHLEMAAAKATATATALSRILPNVGGSR